MKYKMAQNRFCSGDYYYNKDGCCNIDGIKCEGDCNCYHRKHPTLEQFKEEYGEDVPDNMIVCAFYSNAWGRIIFRLYTYGELKSYMSGEDTEYFSEPVKLLHITVCCTPFGKPDNNWRPE